MRAATSSGTLKVPVRLLPRRGGAKTTIQAKASMLPWHSSYPAFDAHPVIGLRHQVCRVLYPIECSLQRLRIREGLRTYTRWYLYRVEVKRSSGKHAREAAARRCDLHGILRRHHQRRDMPRAHSILRGIAYIRP